MALERLGKYELKGVIGRGAAGIVYDARDPVIGRRVAIKTVKLPHADDEETLEELARFRREAQAAGGMSHPNIVPIYDYGETDELAYIVMEFVGGGTLKGVLKDQKQLPPGEALRVMEQLLAGLQYSHDRGIVHRDIKPDNVMLTSDNTVKIADFGIARIEGGGATVVGTMLGTPAYMSPEQWRGDAHIDARSDIYAAGVMLYHLLTGRRPFEGGSQSAIMHAVLNSDPEPPSDVAVSAPPELDAVVLKAMARRADDRFQSASAFAAALKEAVGRIGQGAEADPDRTVIQSSRRPATPAAPPPARAATPATPAKPAAVPAAASSGSKLPIIIAAVVAVLVILGGGGAWLFLGGSKPDDKVVVATPPPDPAAAQRAAQAAAEREAAEKRAAEQAAAEQAAAKLAADQAAAKAASEQAAARAAADQAAAQKAAADQAAAKAAADQAAARTAANQAAAKAAADRAAAEQAAAKAAADQAAAQKAAADQAAARAAAEQAVAAKAAAERAEAERLAAQKAAADQAAARAAAERLAADQAAAAQRAAEQAAAKAAADQAEAARKQAEQLALLNRPVAPVVPAPREALAGMPCAAVYGESTPANLSLRGVVPQDSYAALRASFDAAAGASRNWDVAAIPGLGIYCQVIETLRPALRGLGDAKGVAARLVHSPVTRSAKLRDSDPIDFQVEGPDFASFLQVDYIGSDGSISHYMPRRTQPVLQARRLRANERVRLFDTVAGAAFQVGPPYGVDLVVIIASSEPLQLARSVDDGDNVAAYTTALRNALDAARRKGVRVSVDLVPVESIQ